ncbi:MAG: hypothetical protein ABH824_04775 [Nanoarchaeota archaeon]|nr:hypothetical protein [Nanoarchaeota archaeon]MBU1632848.1 hypothetical protein [Nanoarchaeota archaeon]MBU1875525.1 hypothetical protein [Nanoarchaeota archaeon]
MSKGKFDGAKDLDKSIEKQYSGTRLKLKTEEVILRAPCSWEERFELVKANALLNIDPEDHELRYLRGKTFEKHGLYQDALNDYVIVRETDPDFEDVQTRIDYITLMLNKTSLQ